MAGEPSLTPRLAGHGEGASPNDYYSNAIDQSTGQSHGVAAGWLPCAAHDFRHGGETLKKVKKEVSV